MSNCIACNGTGKCLSGMNGPNGGVILGTCAICSGSGAKPSKKAKKSSIPDPGTTIGSVVSGVGSSVAQAFLDAGKQKIATEVMHGMVHVTKDALEKMGLALPPSPVIDKALAIAMPVLIMLAAQTLGTQAPNALPKALLDNLNAAATYALQGVSKETVEEVSQVALPFAMQIAALGAQAAGQLASSSGQLELASGKMSEESTT